MQCYTELLPPSGVTNAVSLPFTSGTANNLVVARSSLLQIFSLHQVSNAQDMKLVLVAEYSLSGTITALGRVKILNPKSGGEALLIALRDAKLSLVEWDPEQYSICTISIHYYESDELRKCPWAPDLRDCVNHFTVDPSSRCAAFNFGIGNLAIIPFHQLGDDLVMDEYDSLDEELVEDPSAKIAPGDAATYQTPYASSFVLPLTALDSGLLHPVDLAFLYEYREPTFGIIYSTIARSPQLAFERKDVTFYAVFTLDLDQKASTALLSIAKLPNDLYRIVPLPLPVGGALLIGGNELIHVDQGGKTNALGVNEFAKQCSGFPMSDQSEWRMRLEGCQIEQLGNANGDMLLILSTGEMSILGFRLDGRSVSGLSLRPLPEDNNSRIIKGPASCTASLGPSRIFVGSDGADSVLLSTAKKTSLLKKTSSRIKADSYVPAPAESSGEEDGEEGEDDDDDDDDLYGDRIPPSNNASSGDVGMTALNSLRVLDRLLNMAPIRDIALGRPGKRKRAQDEDGDNQTTRADLELVVATGEGQAGGVTILNRELSPNVIKSTKSVGANGVWSVPGKGKNAAGESFDGHLILSRTTDDGNAESSLYSIDDGNMKERTGTEFESSAGGTIDVGSIGGGTHTVQVLEGEVRVYNSDFGLAQIWPIVDEDYGAEAKAISASFADPYVLVARDDSSLLLLKADKRGELDEVNLPPDLMAGKFLSASLYADQAGIFTLDRNITSKTPGSNQLLVSLAAGGALTIHAVADMSMAIFVYDGFHFLPTRLTQNQPLPKHWKNAETLTEVLIADIGDSSAKSSYLFVRTSSDDIVLYQPYSLPGSHSSLRFRKTVPRRVAKAPIEAVRESIEADTRQRNNPLRALSNISGHSMVFVPGASPAFVLKTAHSSPRIHDVRVPAIKALSGYHHPTCSRGFIYIDEKAFLRTAQLPAEINLGHSGWVSRKVELGEEVACLASFERMGSYVLATNHLVDFQLPQDDEWHSEWKEEDTSFLPHVEQGSIKLLSPNSWKIIGSYPLEASERAMCIKCLSLEVSEETHERKDLIVVGTATTKGENVTARGNIYVFDVVNVVPEPGIPETELKLKLVAKEEVKGAVTSLSQVGSQGFLLAAQGQKCMVRGLKEDLSILPVAFMDMKYYVQVVKELAGTGLCILGDAMQGLWLVGYSEEPYKLQLFGRDQLNLEVMAADFLPDGKQLYIVVADGDGDLHVLQFDPEHPKSERGTKLLHRSTFNTGSFPTTMTLLPRTAVSSELAASAESDHMDVDTDYGRHQMLITTQEGGVALITPVSEAAYRRLSTLQNILITNLEHPCGLNPRAYRAVETDGIGGRGMIDGNVVQRWLDQSRQHQTSMADKIGGTVWDIRGDLEAVGGNGLGYL